MAHDLKYGRVTFEHGDVPDDEPVFVVRAQDRLAIPVIANYGLFAAVAGCDTDHLAAVDAAIDTVTEWQRSNETKVPDTVPDADLEDTRAATDG